MSQFPQQSFPQGNTFGADLMHDRPRSNMLGMGGFILSLIGLFASCGTCVAPLLIVVCIAGIALSFFGLFRPRKGLAITGLIIGILALIIGIFGALAWGGMKAMGGAMNAFKIGAIGSGLEEHARKNGGQYPADASAAFIQLPPGWSKDKWGNDFVYEVAPDGKSFSLRSKGPDGILDTPDDPDFTEVLKSVSPNASTMPPVPDRSGNDGSQNDGSGTDASQPEPKKKPI
jgi:hypothetical protein